MDIKATQSQIAQSLNEKLVAEVTFSKDNYKLISFGTVQTMYVVEINGVRQKKTIKRLNKDMKELFNL